jgi:hypothetical protein
MDTQRAAETLASVIDALEAMASNLRYVSAEVPSLAIPDEIAHRVSGVCQAFLESLAEDDASVRRILAAMRASPDAIPPGAAEALEATVSTLWKHLQEMHELITGCGAQDALGLKMLCVLLQESGVNMLNAFFGVRDELEGLLQEWADQRATS